MKIKLLIILLSLFGLFLQGCATIQPEAGSYITNTYNDDGSIKSIKETKDGNEIGTLYFEYYPSGEIKHHMQYVNDILNGESMAYFESGKVYALATYKNGVQDGKFIDYFDNGEIKKAGFYSNDKLDGVVDTYDSEGSIISREEYKDGIKAWEWEYDNKINISIKQFHENGNVHIRFDIKNEMVHGLYDQYYKNGNIEISTSYINGNKSGIQRQFYEEGNLDWEVWFKDEKITEAKQYYQGGNLAKEIDFKDGKAIKGFQYTYDGVKTKMTNAHFLNSGFEY
ncbi:MAG: hypothetical protein QS721_12075 [Candidatus Endonucleobacter sp. (ex Gigantidas childressi)]|nr:hypothetical protein [Candidatus Endonucleobacter sp. (ex Gigantidas childressi)]